MRSTIATSESEAPGLVQVLHDAVIAELHPQPVVSVSETAGPMVRTRAERPTNRLVPIFAQLLLRLREADSDRYQFPHVLPVVSTCATESCFYTITAPALAGV